MEQDEIAPFKIKMVKAQETIKDVYTQGELCALIQPPKREDSFVVWRRSWAIINFILGTAAREATVCEMQMQDVSFDDRTITFRHLKNKHVQLLPMSEALASCLKKYIFPFGGRMQTKRRICSLPSMMSHYPQMH